MRYIDKILQLGEKVLFYGRLHWVIYSPGAFILVLAFAALLFSSAAPGGSPLAMAGLIAAVVFAMAAAVMMFSAWFRRWTTELDVTDRRVVHKRGLIARHTIEINMDKIESVDVDQSMLGRLLGYGDITIHGTGETWEPLCTIGAPLEFRNNVTAR